MKKNRNVTKIIFGILFIAVAVLLLLEAFGILNRDGNIDIPIWKIPLAILLLWHTVKEVVRLRISGIFFPIALLTLLFEKEISSLLGLSSGYIHSAWTILLIALLLTVGFSMLFPRRKIKSHFKHAHRYGDKHNEESNFSSRTVYIDAAKEFSETLDVNFGSMEVYFTNAELYQGNGSLLLDNNFGSLSITVPFDWSVETEIENNFGGITIPLSEGAQSEKRLLLLGDNNFGSISVSYTHEL